MRRCLAIMLSVAVMSTMLVGCNNDNNVDGENQPSSSDVASTVESSSSDVEGNSSSSSSSSESAGDTVENEGEQGSVAASVNDRLGMVIDSVRDNESKDAFKVQTTNENGVLDLVGLSADDLEEFAITYSPFNVHAYIIGVVKPVEGKGEVVLEALKSYNESVVKSFEQYLPDQLVIAQNAVLFEHNGYAGLIMCNASGDVEVQLRAALDKIGDIAIDPNAVTEETDAEENVEADDTEGTTTSEEPASSDTEAVEGETVDSESVVAPEGSDESSTVDTKESNK